MTLHFPNMQGQLTRADNRILDYISGNVEVFLFSSIGELARQTESRRQRYPVLSAIWAALISRN